MGNQYNADKTPPTAESLRRLNKEITNYSREAIEGIYIVQDNEKSNLIHALLVGPADTPYEGGFFYFRVQTLYNYPFKPPLVKLMTTGGGLVRFNPNLYADGKVCLSILGTWAGPGWTPNMTILSVLLSIQSLLNKEPYFNEPGYESQKGQPRSQQASEQYNANVRFQTMNVAVLGMVEEGSLEARIMPQSLKDKMKEVFNSKIDFYTAVLLQNEEDPVRGYAGLKERLQKLVPAREPEPQSIATAAEAETEESTENQATEGDGDCPSVAKRAKTTTKTKSKAKASSSTASKTNKRK